MKVVKSVAGIMALFVILFSLQINVSSCQKEVITDTLYIRDTIRIVDSSDCSCYDLSDGLVAYYNFNNGTLKDSSGYNNHITVSNAVKTADRFGRANNAYLFDGASSYMTVPNSASLNPTKAITLMATIKIKGYYSANCVSNQVFGKGWNDFINGFYVMRFGSSVGCNAAIDTSKELFGCSYGNLNARAGASDNSFIQSNKWYNVVYTYADGESRIYVDGVLKNTGFQTVLFTPNDQELYIGKHGDPQYPYYFNGIIDEVRIYNKALCAAAVTQLYNTKQ
jgi:Concanavalin A-like lectin/glucanases superfamily